MTDAVKRWLLALVFLAWAGPSLAAFDHEHRAWSALLAKHVIYAPDGNASTVRYAGFAAERAALGEYLGALSAVTPAESSTRSSTR